MSRFTTTIFFLAYGTIAILIFQVQEKLGNFSVAPFADSIGYISMSKANLLSVPVLSEIRTIGYPLFLKLLSTLGVSIDSVPTVQWWILVFSVGMLLHLLLGLSRRPYFSLFLSLYLLLVWTFVNRDYQRVGSDALALHLALCLVCLMIHWVKHPFNKPLQIAFCITLFVSYQVRPAYLFLMFLSPLMLGVFCRLVGGSKQVFVHLLSRSVVLCFIPFLLFSTFRYLYVGHFGLVSFGGTNLMAFAGQLLKPEDVVKFPNELRPLGKRFVERLDSNQRLEFGLSHYKSARESFWSVDRAAMTKQADFVFAAAYGAVSDIYPSSSKAERNQRLTVFAKQILSMYPIAFGNWILKSVLYGTQLALQSFANVVALLISLGVCMFLLVAKLLFGKQPLLQILRLVSRINLLGVASLFLFLGQLLLVCVAGKPTPRYMACAGFLLPIVPLAFAWGGGCSILSGIGLRKREASLAKDKMAEKLNIGLKQPIESEFFNF